MFPIFTLIDIMKTLSDNGSLQFLRIDYQQQFAEIREQRMGHAKSRRHNTHNKLRSEYKN
jgi:hypothetical protein